MGPWGAERIMIISASQGASEPRPCVSRVRRGQSDSGSPLLYRRRAFHCTRLILGVMSIDRTCGPTGSSGMYTKVTQYIPWIESIVWP
ncbi:unnamed protein product [Spodoptera littoralis]|uniref:Peptidase S1 domain-containing protein n=1 Tax=Spodoptera littoralis TaxID=7109 RepID=A0A9P0N2Q4_SPOLI|nr:unnamed protein product [Spodoptera littoralis]CAH1642496.1 unnamed protein product [Spodoptera littoralis]